jgi:hypothetical protein
MDSSQTDMMSVAETDVEVVEVESAEATAARDASLADALLRYKPITTRRGTVMNTE